MFSSSVGKRGESLASRRDAERSTAMERLD
jgi:hypothetical protein